MARISPTRNTPRESQHQARVVDKKLPEHVIEHDKPRTRTRRKNFTGNPDKFYIPMEEIPQGLTYEWKRWTNMGEHDAAYIAEQMSQGWEPVPAKRHPHWNPPGYNEPHIIRHGMILMDRPEELTEEFKREMRQLSKRQVRDQEARLGKAGDGEATRDFDGVRPKLTKEYFRAVPVEE